MHRRDFCKIAIAAAAAKAIPAMGQATDMTGEPAFHEFNTYTRTFAEFCALPPDHRDFYALIGGQLEKEKLDERAWQAADIQKPTTTEPPSLPIPGGSWYGVPIDSPIPGLGGDGPYNPTWDSLLQYEVPEWYRDAKFGIWAHWCPQCVPEDGDWYARNMYMEGSPQYKYHIDHYGHQSRFGYKDLCAQWTLLNWEPEELMQRYRRAGARIFTALANHHDGFDTWDSEHQPWNAARIGPHRDVVGTWARVAREQGLRFGVTVHQARNWWWSQHSHGADATGAFAGVPYDGDLTMADGKGQWWQGLDPQRLYSVKHPANALPDISYVKNFYDRTRDLIDKHSPDQLSFDDTLLPLGWGGMNIGSYYYNRSLKALGNVDAVLNVKFVPDHLLKAVVADFESGLAGAIMPYPWQSNTCIGSFHYNKAFFEHPGEYGGYRHPRDIIHWLVDTVSKNGTFILNIPGKPDGTIDNKEVAVLDKITDWMQINSEAIHDTRPWKIFGEGPDAVKSGAFHGDSISALGQRDVRFTRNKTNTIIYAIFLGWPTGEVVIRSLGTVSAAESGRVDHVQLLGTDEKVKWTQTPAGLRIILPEQYRPPTDFAAALKIFRA